MSEIEIGCAPFEEDLSALLDGELDAARSAGVQAHTAACPACARRLAALRAMDVTLQGVAASPLAGEAERLARVRAGVLAELRGGARAAAPPRRRRRWLAPALAGAAAAAAAALFALREPVEIAAPPASTRAEVVAEAASRVQPDPEAFAGRGASAPPEPAAAASLADAVAALGLDVSHLQEMSALERGELVARLAQRAGLPPDARARLERDLERWPSLSPAERDAILRAPPGR
jgi:anti-sigma factor RsiW